LKKKKREIKKKILSIKVYIIIFFWNKRNAVKEIAKRCAVFRPCFSSFRVRIIDAQAQHRHWMLAPIGPHLQIRVCVPMRLHMRPPTHEILASSACVLYARTRARTHACTHVRTSASRGRVEILRPSVKPPRTRENYCTTCDLSLIINTPTPGNFSPTHARDSCDDDEEFQQSCISKMVYIQHFRN